MLIALIQLAGGFVLLVWGADRLVTGASGTARNLGVAPMIIGLTIVAFGTSAPELVVSAVAAYQNKTGLAVGNAIGSYAYEKWNLELVVAVFLMEVRRVEGKWDESQARERSWAPIDEAFKRLKGHPVKRLLPHASARLERRKRTR